MADRYDGSVRIKAEMCIRDRARDDGERRGYLGHL